MKTWQSYLTWLPHPVFPGRWKMCSLALFPPPLPPGEITLCEANNELLSGGTSTEDQLKQVWFTLRGYCMISTTTTLSKSIKNSVFTLCSIFGGCKTTFISPTEGNTVLLLQRKQRKKIIYMVLCCRTKVNKEKSRPLKARKWGIQFY